MIEKLFKMRKLIKIIKGIYLGGNNYMNNKLFWYLYNLFKPLKYLLSFSNKVRIDDQLSYNLEPMFIEPKRIEFYVKTPYKKSHNTSNTINWRGLELKKFPKLNKNNIFNELNAGSLYKSIQHNGFKSQKDLGINNNDDEVKAAIDQNGKYILINGFNRLEISKVLSLQKVPIIIVSRHPKWLKFKREIYIYSQEQPQGVYQQIIHPDFQHLTFHRKSDKRWGIIKDNLPIKQGSLLDIGSNWGYFCHKFEDLGFSCTAIEKNYRWGYYLKKLREIENKSFKIIIDSIFNIDNPKYDIVLALSIFHGFMREKKLYEMLTEYLKIIDMKYMFFEPHVEHELERGYYKQYNPDEFIDYIIENTCLSKSKYLGESNRGRKIYLLS